MILVTLGTQDKEFTRLLKAIDKAIDEKKIKDKVIVQAGFTKYKSKNMEIFDYISSTELEKLVKECDILITHGGVGSILMGLNNNKKVIAAARLSKYGEHTNDHQIQIIKEFKNRGYIIELDDFNKLSDIIKNIKSFKPTKYKSNNDNFVNNIEKYIEEDSHISWYNKYRELVSNGYKGIIVSLINLVLFYLLKDKLSIFYNILISYIITIGISFILNLIIDIKYNIKKFIIVNIISLILEILLIILFINIFNLELILSMSIVILIVLILSLVINKIYKEN